MVKHIELETTCILARWAAQQSTSAGNYRLMTKAKQLGQILALIDFRRYLTLANDWLLPQEMADNGPI